MKQRVLRLYDEAVPTSEIARRLCVSRSWCRRVKQRRDEPPRKPTGRPPKLSLKHRKCLAQWVAEKPDATLGELHLRLQKDLGITVSIGCLWNTLHAMNFTFKKSR